MGAGRERVEEERIGIGGGDRLEAVEEEEEDGVGSVGGE